MTAIHGLASTFCTGLGQLVGGKPKEGLGYLGKEVGCGAAITAGTLGALAAKSVTKEGTKDLGKFTKLIAKNPKVASAIGISVAVAGSIGFVVNRVKSIVDAAKIDQKTDKPE